MSDNKIVYIYIYFFSFYLTTTERNNSLCDSDYVTRFRATAMPRVSLRIGRLARSVDLLYLSSCPFAVIWGAWIFGALVGSGIPNTRQVTFFNTPRICCCRVSSLRLALKGPRGWGSRYAFKRRQRYLV